MRNRPPLRGPVRPILPRGGAGPGGPVLIGGSGCPPDAALPGLLPSSDERKLPEVGAPVSNTGALRGRVEVEVRPRPDTATLEDMASSMIGGAFHAPRPPEGAWSEWPGTAA